MEGLKTFVINEGIKLHTVKTENQGNKITVFYRTEAKKERAAIMAVLAKCLKISSEKYRTRHELEGFSERCRISSWDVFTVRKGNEHILCLDFGFNRKSDIAMVCSFLKEVLFYPKTDKYAFADTDKAVFAVESDILSLCDDFKSYGKMRFAEEMSRGTDLGIRNNGFLEDVYDVKGNDVYMMYSSVIRRCICEIYYTGDAQTEIVREEISKVFEGRRGHIENIAENKAVLCSKARAVKEKRSISESMLYVGFAQKEDRGKENIFPVMILNEIFGGSSGMLFRKVREQKALCYYVSGSLYSFKQLICAEAAIDEKDMKNTVKAIKDAFEDIRKEENVKERINTAKNILKKKALSIKDSGDSMVDFCLDNSINGFEYTIEEFADRIEKTTEEDVLKCAENFEMDTVYFLEGVK